jgi:hypothetical protein
MDNVTSAMDNGVPYVLDFAKAFEKEVKERLLKK